MAEEKHQSEQWLEVTPYRRGGRKLGHAFKLLTALAKVRLVPETYGRVEKAAAGFVIRLDPAAIGGGGTPGTAVVSKFTFQSSQSDYITCHDGVGADVYIAKPAKLRGSVTSETIDGTTISYGTFSGDYTERTASAAGYTDEVQAIVPRFLVNDVIYAATVDGGTGVGSAPTYVDLNVDGRAWAKKVSP